MCLAVPVTMDGIFYSSYKKTEQNITSAFSIFPKNNDLN